MCVNIKRYKFEVNTLRRKNMEICNFKNFFMLLLFYVISLPIYVVPQEVSENKPLVKYFIENTPVELKCFSERRNDADISSLTWDIGGLMLTENDTESNSEYSMGESRGDITIRNLSEEKNASCSASIGDGETVVFNQYILQRGSIPEINFLVGGEEVEGEFAWAKNEEVQIDCQAINSSPLSNLSLFLGEKLLEYLATSEKISANITFYENVSSEELACQIDHPVETLQKILHLAVKVPPKKASEAEFSDMELGSPFNLTFSVRSIPSPSNFRWSLLENCSSSNPIEEDFNDRYYLGDPKDEVSGESSHMFIYSLTISNFSAEDLNRCFRLNVSNDVGSLLLEFNVREAVLPDSVDTLQIVWISALVLLVVISLVVTGSLWWFVWRKRQRRASSGYAPPGHDLNKIET